MTLDALLLQKLAKWRPASDKNSLDLADPDSGWSASLTAHCVDQVGCRVWELTVRRSSPLADTDLTARAGRVAEQVTGLLEPLRLLEVDTGRNEALLRSEAPGEWGEGRHYYELSLRGDGACTLRRYEAPSREEPRRRQIAFALTHEALAKLVRDLTA